jgi:transposase
LRDSIISRSLRCFSWNGVHALHFDQLLPAADRVVVQSVRIAPAKIEVELQCSLEAASCPICQTPSRRIHSRYIRVVSDLPWAGTPMILRFSTRRFFCDNVDCSRHIFAEELPDLARRRRRSTPRLDQALVEIGLESGGEPGRRLAGEMGINTSGDTILRRLRALPLESAHRGDIIGVDDFAFRRGQHYGTIVVDHESGGVIDLLPDRSSATVQTWIAARPAAPTVVTRDRSGIFASAITAAAPEAVQVADRWHLLLNCREALVRLLHRHHDSVAQALAAIQPETPSETPILDTPAPIMMATTTAEQPVAVAAVTKTVTLSKSQQQSIDRRAKRVAQYEQVLELHRQGHSQRDIMLQMKMCRRRVKKLINAGAFPERAKRHHTRQVDRYLDHLKLRWEQGVRNVKELTQSIRTLGYAGGADMVKRCVAPWRTAIERLRLRGSKPKPRSPTPLKLQRPNSDRLSWLFIKDDIVPRAGETALLAELRSNCEPIRLASELARSFGEAIRKRDLDALTIWKQQALKTTSLKEIHGFAEGIVRTWPEVKAAMELPWSNGRAEGHVNRLKLIKRKMFGRAKLDLLRIRVMASGP